LAKIRFQSSSKGFILKVLSYTNILDELLFHDNIVTIKHPYDIFNICVEFKNMIMGDDKLFLLSHHDIAIDTVVDENVIQNFIDKYERRWHRMMDIINNSNQSLIFIHRITNRHAIEKIDPGDEDKFIELISTINPNCKFCLVFLHHFALKTPKWQRYLHSFTPTLWAF